MVGWTFGLSRLPSARMSAADLRRIRELLRLTQAQLAAKVYLHPNTVARMERGELPVSRQTEALVRSLVRS